MVQESPQFSDSVFPDLVSLQFWNGSPKGLKMKD